MGMPILMTASVSTRGMKGACFSDEEREKMYIESIKHYLKALPERRIVFAENSGWNLDALRAKVGADDGRMEYISVDPGVCDNSRGKGYNEILLMNDAVARSEFIKSAGAFMKVTGRYPIYNLGRYLGAADKFFAKGGKYYGDIKDHKVFDWLFPGNTVKWNGHAAYTVLFATTVDFYREHLSETYSQCNDYTNDWIECVWFKVLKPFRGKKRCGVRLRLPVEPVCGGMQGSTAQTIAFSQSNESAKAKFARFVGNCIRVFTPWFWF